MTTARAGTLLALILAAAFAIRLFVVLSERGRPLAGDETTYDEIAWNVASGHGYSRGAAGETLLRPTALRGPAYVLFVAACYRVAGRVPTVPLALQAVLDAVAALLAYRLAATWFGRSSIALVAAALVAFYPPFVQSASSLLTETLTTVLLLGALLTFFAGLERPRPVLMFASGILLGVAALSKPQLAPAGLVLIVAALPRLGRRRALQSAAVLMAATALVMAPWVARNAIVFHAFVPGVSLGRLNLWFGSGAFGDAIGGLDHPSVPDSVRLRVGRMSEIEADRYALEPARRAILEHPGRYAILTIRKLFRLVFNLGYAQPPSRASLLVAIVHAAAIALSVIGARALRPRPPAGRALLLLGIFWIAVHVPFVPVVRYALPFLAVLFVFTAAGLVAVIERVLPSARDRAVAVHGRQA